MNISEQKMVSILKTLKQDFNVVAVKAEFEAEATRLDEAIRLKEITDSADLALIIKIGGAEAIRDMFDAQLLDVKGLIAPMIESPYALQKYLEAIHKFFPKELIKGINFGINIETIHAYKSLKEIFKTPKIKTLSTITVGRVDLSLSMGMKRDEINNERIYKITEDICKFAKSKGFSTTIGGGIAIEAIPFIKKLKAKELLDRYETRKVVFIIGDSVRKISKGILLANEFELLWLKNKKNYYSAIYEEDDIRISMLQRRLVMGKKAIKG